MSLETILAGFGLGPEARPGAGPPKNAALNPRIVRSLTEEDLVSALVEGTEIGAKPIKALRQKHHSIAKMVAQGLPAVEISAVLGTTTNWIAVLRADPSFEELVAYYAAMEEAHWDRSRADVVQRLTDLGLGAMEEISERLETNPAAFSAKELFSLAELALDRIGHGKQQTQNVNVTHGLSPETLSRLRQHGDAPAQLSETDRGALARLALSTTRPHPSPETAGWIEGEGSLIREEAGEGAGEGLSDDLLSPMDRVLRQEREGVRGAGPLPGESEGGDPGGEQADGRPAGSTAAGRALQALANGGL